MKKQILALAFSAIGMIAFHNAEAQKVKGDHKHENVLNLTADQKAKLKALKKTEKEQLKAIKADSTTSAADRKQKAKELHSNFAQQEKSILTPDQQAKQDSLRATHKQFGKGGKKKTAFSKISLTDEQKQSVKSIRQSQHEKIIAVRNNTNLSDSAKKEQLTSIRKEGRAAFEKLLTADQKAQIKKTHRFRKNESVSSNS